MKVLAMRGISGSGKSRAAAELKAQGWAVVSRDDIRETMFKDYASVDENAVTVIEDAAINALLTVGKNVVIDDTNIRQAYLKRFAAIAAKHNASFDVKQIDVELKVAQARVFERVALGGRDVPAAVIEKQAKSLKASKLNLNDLYVPEFTPYVADESLPDAILVDVDGTVAKNNGHRGFYDYEKVGDDDVVQNVADVVNMYWSNAVNVIVMSGRDDSSAGATAEWFLKHKIPFDAMHMRKTGDQRKDSIVKIELFDEHVRDKYNVLFVLDDRQQVVDAWRSIGLTCLQVAPGDF